MVTALSIGLVGIGSKNIPCQDDIEVQAVDKPTKKVERAVARQHPSHER